MKEYLKFDYEEGIIYILSKYPEIDTSNLREAANRFIEASLTKFDSFSLGVVLTSFYLDDSNLELLPNKELIKEKYLT